LKGFKIHESYHIWISSNVRNLYNFWILRIHFFVIFVKNMLITTRFITFCTKTGNHNFCNVRGQSPSLPTGSFRVKSSKILIQPDITDSDLLEILQLLCPMKKLANFFPVNRSCKYGSSKFDRKRATQFLQRLISPLL